MWEQLVDAVREVTAAHPDAAADVVAMSVCSQYSSIVPVDADGEPVAPMLMWQDQRGTDHSFDDHEPRRGRVHDVRSSATASRRSAAGSRSGHILYLQLDRPDVHAATAAYVEAMDYVTARLTGPHRRVAAHVVHGAVSATTARSARPRTTTSSCSSPASTPRACRRSCASTRRSARSCPTSRSSSACPESVVVYAPTNDTAAVAIATGAFTAGRAGLAIGTTSVLVDAVADFRTDLEHQILSMPGPYVDRYVVCAENGLGGKVLEHVLERVVYARRRRSPTTASPTSFAPLDAVLDATEPGAGGVLFLPWLSGSLAPIASGTIRGGFVNMSLETDRADLVRAVVEGVAHNLAWLLPHVETFTGERDRRDRVRRRRGALGAVVPGARRRARPAGRRRSTRPRSARRGRWALLALAAPRRALRATISTAPRPTTTATLRARSHPPRALRIPSGAVRGRVRGAPPDQ